MERNNIIRLSKRQGIQWNSDEKIYKESIIIRVFSLLALFYLVLNNWVTCRYEIHVVYYYFRTKIEPTSIKPENNMPTVLIKETSL